MAQTPKTILVAGTWDTKSDELGYICDVIVAQGGAVVKMDVSVLGNPAQAVDVTKQDVAQAAGQSIDSIIALGDENAAMQAMARGSTVLAARLQAAGRIDGALVLGGTMGTDLALDLCAALPLGVPKYIVSTVSFSAMLPPERLPADVQMILWAGGLYGLNAICRASLSQAAGAVLGAARAVEPPQRTRPMVGMTSFGKTALRYMVHLRPALEARGFDLAVFHATGMGGRAFEHLAAAGEFAAVMDFAPQEVGNHLFGSGISAGPDRLTAAGLRGVPQLVSIGCHDLVDLVGWQSLPARFQGYASHAHNRLLTSVALAADDRRAVARAMARALAQAHGPVTLLVPLQGAHEWDRENGPMRDPEGLGAFVEELRAVCPENVDLIALPCHINDPAFADAALAVFDDWCARGLVSA